MTGYVQNIEELTKTNTNFRHVVYTGKYCQLVLMTLQPGEEIGMEVHPETDQFFRVDAGQGKVIMNGEESIIGNGTAMVIPAGTNHNVINTSSTETLNLYTIYSPPHHKDGIIHATKAIAEADTTDHL